MGGSGGEFSSLLGHFLKKKQGGTPFLEEGRAAEKRKKTGGGGKMGHKTERVGGWWLTEKERKKQRRKKGKREVWLAGSWGSEGLKLEEEGEKMRKGEGKNWGVFSRIFAGEELSRCVLCGFFFSSSVHVFHYIFTFMHSPCCLSFHSPFECDCYAIFSFSVISVEAITYMGSYASCYLVFFFSAIHVILNWWVHCWVVRLGTENAEWPLPKMCCEFPYYYC